MPTKNKGSAVPRRGRAQAGSAKSAPRTPNTLQRRRLPKDPTLLQSLELGRQRAARTLARQRKAAQRRRKRPAPGVERAALARAWALAPAGLLMIQGDSWFDYGRNDISDLLRDVYGYEIDGEAKHGARIVSLADDAQKLDALCDRIATQYGSGKTPKAILLSGGGNDIADNFLAYLNLKNSPLSGWNPTMVDQFVNVTLKQAFSRIISHLDTYCTKLLPHAVSILVHGYSHPVPDGRGIWIGDPGWLRPGFEQQGYLNQQERTDLAAQFIDKFNAMLSRLRADTGVDSVVYVDVRSALSSGRDWKRWWENELHPTDEVGFPAVTKVFADKIGSL